MCQPNDYITSLLKALQDVDLTASSGKTPKTNNRGPQKPIADISAMIKNVIFNDPVTVILWNDGSKTVVYCGEGEPFDEEKGLAMAIVKRICGNTSAYHEILKTHIWDKEKEEVGAEA